jgi:hypothetical protein
VNPDDEGGDMAFYRFIELAEHVFRGLPKEDGTDDLLGGLKEERR